MKVVIIDDHPLVRKGIAMVLSLEGDIEVIGEASDVESGINLIMEEKPDLALIDLRLGKKSGLDVVVKIDRKDYKGKLVILTTSSEERDFKNAEAAEVDGYILKDALPEEICYAIRLISKGRKYYDPGVMEALVKDENQSDLDCLTCREKDVLKLLGKGLSNMEIAGTLYITEHTVKKHVSQILSKLGYADRTQAAIHAVTAGLV